MPPSHWQVKDPLGSSYHCSAATVVVGVSFVECVIVNPGQSGAYVGSMIQVTNVSSEQRVVEGTTETLIDQGTRFSYVECGSTAILAGETLSCHTGARVALPHGRDVWAQGALTENAINTAAVSPKWKT